MSNYFFAPVEALQIANTQGQKIYTITKENISTILPNLQLSLAIINKIKTEVSRGKEVTTHTSSVSVPGWSGAGYIVIDPKSGDGAYVISGGSNGGFMQIVYAIYLLLYLMWSDLDATAAIFWKTFLRTIAELLDAIRDIHKIYAQKGTAQAVAAAAIFVMLTGMTALLLHAMSAAMALAIAAAVVGPIVGGIINYILGALIVYGMALTFNIIVPRERSR